MEGDRLAKGARSATFAVAPNLKFDEGIMRDDLRKLPSEAFILKYMITQREYDLIVDGSDEKVSSFAEEMHQRAELYTRQIDADIAQEDTLRRDCFLVPFVALGLTGRVIVSRDGPVDKPSKLALPKSLRKDKTLLPTTGHVLKAKVFDDAGAEHSDSFIGKRVLFSPMSGTAICFKGYPTWIQLELSEILAIVPVEDASLVEEELEPMV